MADLFVGAIIARMRGPMHTVKAFGGPMPPGKFYSLGDNDQIEEVYAGRNFIFPPNPLQRTQEQIAQMSAKPKAKYPDWVQCIAGAICGLTTGLICGWAWIYFQGC